MKTSVRILLLSVFSISFLVSGAQEYDDLYFSKKDRKKKVEPDEQEYTEYATTFNTEESGQKKNTSFLGRQYQVDDDEVATIVSQESIDRYKRSDIDTYQGDEEQLALSTDPADAPNYVTEDAYLDPVVINNNYYGYGSRFWGPDPLRARYRFGFNNSLWLTSFHNPWYDPFWDPFIVSPWSFNINFGWGFGSFARWGGFYDPFWCPPYWGNSFAVGYRRGFYSGRYDNRVVYSRLGRTVERGARTSRGGNVSTSGRSTRLAGTSIASEANDTRDFSRQQAKYLNRSRKGTQVSSGNNARIISRRSGTGTSTRSRVGNSSSSRSRSNSSYNRSSSNTRQRSYTPSRSSSRSSGVRSSPSRPSRSSGYRSSSPSRSSGGSYRSSGSSRSSSGRSSSGRSSSGRSSRGRGN